MPLKLSSPVFFYALLASAAAMAKANEATFLDMDLEQLLQVKITGATLRQESIKTVPSPTTVFTREQLDSLGLDYLHELLDLVPGFQTNRSADSPLNYTYSVNGRRQGGRAREVLLLVDGRVFAEPRSGGADSAIILYPLANIERIEIIRGPASAIYGSGAFTGVINIISRRQQNSISLGLGENERGKLDIALTRIEGEWEQNLYAHLAEDKGQFYRIGEADTRDPRQEVVIDWNLKYRNTRIQAFVSSLQGEDFYTLEKINNGFNQYRHESRHFRIEQDLSPSDDWKMSASLSYQKVQQYLDATLQPAGTLEAISMPASIQPMLAKASLASDSFRVHLANDVDVNDLLSLQFGGEWQRERQTDARSRTNYDLLQLVKGQYPVSYYGNFDHATLVGLNAERDVGGLYGQLLYQLTADTRLIGGLRYDYYETIGGHASPRLGLIHQLNAHHTLKLLYGEAFRAPSFSETHLINSSVLVSNPNLDNETVKTWELLWMGTWSTFSVEASIYHNDYGNPITTGFIGSTRTYVNDADQANLGGSLRMEWQLTPNWMLRGHYTTLKDMPDTFFREAEELGSVGFNYQHGKWNWNLSAIYRSGREYLLTSTARAPLSPYWYANTQLRYRINSLSTLALVAKNMFDTDYASPPQGLVGPVPNRGREASLVWRWEW